MEEEYRVDRVLGFFSNRPNWDHHTLHPLARVSPPGSGGALACGRGGGAVPMRTIGVVRHCGTLGVYVLCGEEENRRWKKLEINRDETRNRDEGEEGKEWSTEEEGRRKLAF